MGRVGKYSALQSEHFPCHCTFNWAHVQRVPIMPGVNGPIGHSALNRTYARIFRNVSWLFSAQIIVGILGLVSLAIMARAIGPVGIGIIAVVQAFVRAVERLVRLEPWQALIQAGTRALENEQHQRFIGLVKLSLLINVAGAILAGSLTLAASSFAAHFFDLPPMGQHYVQLFAVGTFFSLRPTGLGILRIFDRFDLLAKIDVATAALRLTLSLGALAMGMGIWAFISILLVESLANGLAVFFVAMRVMHGRGHHGVLRANARKALDENPGFLRFLWNSNFNVMLRQSAQRFDVLILSNMVTPEIIGLYHLGKRLADAVLKMSRPLSQAIYPEFARIWAGGVVSSFRSIVFTTSGLLFLISVVVFVPIALNMSWILKLFFGEEFVAATTLVQLQLFAVLISLTGMLLNPALLGMGRDRELVRITLAAAVTFFVLLVPLVNAYGAAGAAIDHIIFNTIWLIASITVLIRGTKWPNNPVIPGQHKGS